MEVSALKYSGGIGLHGRSPLLRLQSDERLIALLRRGNMAAFEILVSRYETRLMAFCRHLLGSREDAEDVLQEVLTAAFNAILADQRPINVRPWLYRIARNRSLNHLRRIQAIGVDSMDHHLSEHGASTADKVHEREEFRLLVGDIHELPETQKTALVLREMDALSYEQIAEAMETTVPSVKSLLVRARVSLAEAAEARLLSCDEVRIELAEVAEGLQRRPSALVRRHLRSCKRCSEFRAQLKVTNKALAALLPVGPLAMFHKLLFIHLGHSAGAGSSAAGTSAGASAVGAGAGAAGATAAGAGAGAMGAGGTLAAGSGAIAGSSGFVSAGLGAFAGKAAAGLAAAALVTAGAVEADHPVTHHHAPSPPVTQASTPSPAASEVTHAPSPAPAASPYAEPRSTLIERHDTRSSSAASTSHKAKSTTQMKKAITVADTGKSATPAPTATTPAASPTPQTPSGRTQTQSDPTVLSSSSTSTFTPTPGSATTGSGGAAVDPYPAQTAQAPGSSSSTTSTSSSQPAAGSGDGTSTTATTPTGTTTDPGTTTTGTTTTPGTTTTGTTTTGTTTSPGTTTTGTTTTPGTTTTTTTTTTPGSTTTTTPGTTSPSAGGTAPTAAPAASMEKLVRRLERLRHG